MGGSSSAVRLAGTVGASGCRVPSVVRESAQQGFHPRPSQTSVAIMVADVSRTGIIGYEKGLVAKHRIWGQFPRIKNVSSNSVLPHSGSLDSAQTAKAEQGHQGGPVTPQHTVQPDSSVTSWVSTTVLHERCSAHSLSLIHI